MLEMMTLYSGEPSTDNQLVFKIRPSTSARNVRFYIARAVGEITYDKPGKTALLAGDGRLTVTTTIPVNAEYMFVKLRVNGPGTQVPLFQTESNDYLVAVEAWGKMDPRFNISFSSSISLITVPDHAPNWTNWTAIFDSCFEFNQDISHWKTGHVTDMSSAFSRCLKLDSLLNDWDVSNVTTMFAMFYAMPYNRPLNNWDVGKVTSMNAMFYGLNRFNQPLDNWDVSNVIDLRHWLLNCTAFNQNLSNLRFPKLIPVNRTGYDQNTSAWLTQNKPNFLIAN